MAILQNSAISERWRLSPGQFAILSFFGFIASMANAQTVPPGFTITELVSTGLSDPIRICLGSDGRVFIAERGSNVFAHVKLWKESTGLLPTPYYTFLVSVTVEGGLLGIALNPDPQSEHTLFAWYTSGGGRVVSIRAAHSMDDVAIPNSETLLMQLYTSSGTHNGGGLQFGPDGKLYVSVGERGGNSQSLENLGGKVLRINPDGTIPEDNPISFQGIAGSPLGVNRAIFAVGFRNPFNLAIQPITGRILVNDVGSSLWEEINDCRPGRNYGWPVTEGYSNPQTTLPVTRPVYAYPYSPILEDGGLVIVGGVFYNPPICTFPPEYYNAYLFADFSMNWIRRLDLDDSSVSGFATGIGGVTDMKVDAQGRIYLVSMQSQRLLRIEYTAPLPPALAHQPKSVRVCPGEVARFSFVPSGTLPMAYQWRHDNVDLIDNARISGANMPELTINDVRSVDTGLYQCFISNVHGNVLTAAVELNLGMTGGSRTGNEIARFVSILQSGTANSTDLCHFDFDGNGLIEQGDIAGLIGRLLE